MSNPRPVYAKLGEETPMFSVTPGKNCKMFPYLWSKECAAFYGPNGSPADNPFRCKSQGPASSIPDQTYLGFPVNFNYSLSGETGCDSKPAEYPPIIGEQLQVQENYQDCPCAKQCPCHRKVL